MNRNTNFFVSLQHAISGIVYVIRHERNFRIQLCFTLLAILFSFFYGFSVMELFVLYFAIFIVLLMECVNTAFERMVDLCTKEIHPLAKAVKDVAAGAVLLASVFAFVVGVLLFFRLDVLTQILLFLQANPALIAGLAVLLVGCIWFVAGFKD